MYVRTDAIPLNFNPSDLFLPVSGEIIEFNEELEDTPEDVNADPYSKGWMIKLKVSNILLEICFLMSILRDIKNIQMTK